MFESAATPEKPVIVAPLDVVERASTDLHLGRDETVAMAKKFIYANVGKGINVNDVVVACSLSRRALEKRFHYKEGRSIHTVIHESRLELARSLLACGKNVSEASRECGFRTVQHFHYAFKKRYGLTPGAYVMNPSLPGEEAGTE